MVDSNTADDVEEFRNGWNNHINELYKLGHSLPETEIEEFMDSVEKVEEFVEMAANHTFEE